MDKKETQTLKDIIEVVIDAMPKINTTFCHFIKYEAEMVDLTSEEIKNRIFKALELKQTQTQEVER